MARPAMALTWSLPAVKALCALCNCGQHRRRSDRYINAHGTSTPAGDITELNAVKETFGDNCPAVSSTKSLTGHSLGATGVQEAIYSLIMMRDGFIAGSANVEELDPGAEGVDVSQTRDQQLTRVMSNSFGFGGTNASLVFQAYQG